MTNLCFFGLSILIGFISGATGYLILNKWWPK